VHRSPFVPHLSRSDAAVALRRTQTDWQVPAQEVPQNQLAFPSFVGSNLSTPHGARTLADDGADASFISRRFLKTTKALRTIPLASPIACEAYDGEPREQIIERVEFYLKIGTHLEHTHAYVIESCGSFDLILGFQWRAIHDPDISWRDKTITFPDKFCQRHCYTTDSVPQILCNGSNQAHPTSQNSAPSSDSSLSRTTAQPEPESDMDIKIVSFRSAQLFAKRRENQVFLLRRAITEEDYDKFFKPSEDPPLDTLLSPEEMVEYADCLPTFNRDAAQKLPDHGPFDHEIKLIPGMDPPNIRPRPFSGQQAEAIERYIEDNEARGFIERTSSPARNNLLIVAKPGGGLRVCVDYRQLNDVTIKDRHPIPFFRETLSQLNGAKIFSKFDVIYAFHRIRIKPGSEWLTAFSTRKGTYQYKVMPFGLCNAPATF
jgi:hypothetical protein